MRSWQNTIEQSEQFNVADGYELRPGMSKFGISINDQFTYKKMEVAALVFLNNQTDELKNRKSKNEGCFFTFRA
ncbi:hypothetical protein V7S76_09825 [Aquirufa sp. ROCK2-A2]